MGWVITKARGNERLENRRRQREQERHNGRGRQEKKGSQNEDGGKRERRDFSLFCSLQWLHKLSLNESFIPRLLNAKIKELKLLPLNTQSH